MHVLLRCSFRQQHTSSQRSESPVKVVQWMPRVSSACFPWAPSRTLSSRWRLKELTRLEHSTLWRLCCQPPSAKRNEHPQRNCCISRHRHRSSVYLPPGRRHPGSRISRLHLRGGETQGDQHGDRERPSSGPSTVHTYGRTGQEQGSRDLLRLSDVPGRPDAARGHGTVCAGKIQHRSSRTPRL